MPSNLLPRRNVEPEQPKNNLSDFVGRIVGHSLEHHHKQERNKSLRGLGVNENHIN